MQPLVSIVMPVYNTERYLPEAVRSVLAQTFQNWELLVLSDESPGDARSVMAGFDDPRIRFLEHKNGGPAFTRNRGMRESRGEFIAFLDSDDVWLPEKLDKQLALFQQNPDAGVVYSQRETIDEQGRILEGYKPTLYAGKILDRLYVDNFVCMSSAVMRREVMDKVGLIDERLRMSEDFDYWLRVACFFQFAYVDEPLVKYRLHSSQVSTRTDYRIKTVWEIRERFDREFGQHVGFWARRRAKALHFSHKAFRNEQASGRIMVLADYLRALRWYPLDGFSWRGIGRLLLPATLATLYRRMRDRQGNAA